MPAKKGAPLPKPIVYQALNTINGKRYIGVTRLGLHTRRYHHLREARAGGKCCPRLYMALRKYGESAFEWSVLEEYETRAAAIQGEIDWIAKISPEYNVSPGGFRSGTRGTSRPVICLEDGLIFESATDAARFYGGGAGQVLISCKKDASAVGRHFRFGAEEIPEQQRLQTLAAIIENKEKKLKWENRSPEWREKSMAAFAKGRASSGATKKWNIYRSLGPKSSQKAVVCLNDGKVYESVKAAGKAYGVSSSSIGVICKRDTVRRTVAGLVFRYVGDEAGGLEEAIAENVLARRNQSRPGIPRIYKRKSVICISDGVHYDSVTAAGVAYGVQGTYISQVCKGKRQMVRGLRFRYASASDMQDAA